MTEIVGYVAVKDKISTHTPLAGRDVSDNAKVYGDAISTHTPLAGRDYSIF